jgi:hypothetical protein
MEEMKFYRDTILGKYPREVIREAFLAVLDEEGYLDYEDHIEHVRDIVVNDSMPSDCIQAIHDRILPRLPQYTSFHVMCALQEILSETSHQLGDNEIIELVCERCGEDYNDEEDC